MPTFTDVMRAVHAEFSVLMEYLHSSGFLNFGLNGADLAGLKVTG